MLALFSECSIVPTGGWTLNPGARGLNLGLGLGAWVGDWVGVLGMGIGLHVVFGAWGLGLGACWGSDFGFGLRFALMDGASWDLGLWTLDLGLWDLQRC